MAGDFGSFLRSVWRNEDFTAHPDARYLLLYYYEKVRHTPGTVRHHGEVVPCERGQGVTSREEEMRATGMTERKVRTAREVLEKLGIVSYATTNRRTVFSFVDPEGWLPRLSEKVQQNVQRKMLNSSCGRPAESVIPHKNQESAPRYGFAWKYTPMVYVNPSILNLNCWGKAEGSGKSSNTEGARKGSGQNHQETSSGKFTKGSSSPPKVAQKGPPPATVPAPASPADAWRNGNDALGYYRGKFHARFGAALPVNWQLDTAAAKRLFKEHGEAGLRRRVDLFLSNTHRNKFDFLTFSGAVAQTALTVEIAKAGGNGKVEQKTTASAGPKVDAQGRPQKDIFSTIKEETK